MHRHLRLRVPEFRWNGTWVLPVPSRGIVARARSPGGWHPTWSARCGLDNSATWSRMNATGVRRKLPREHGLLHYDGPCLGYHKPGGKDGDFVLETSRPEYHTGAPHRMLPASTVGDLLKDLQAMPGTRQTPHASYFFCCRTVSWRDNSTKPCLFRPMSQWWRTKDKLFFATGAQDIRTRPELSFQYGNTSLILALARRGRQKLLAIPDGRNTRSLSRASSTPCYIDTYYTPGR